jgi:hypothetical protein
MIGTVQCRESRVGKAAVAAPLTDHSCCRDGTGEWAHAGFVDTCDMKNARIPKCCFIAQETAQPLPLRAVGEAAALDRWQDGFRSRPGIASESCLQASLKRPALVGGAAPDLT